MNNTRYAQSSLLLRTGGLAGLVSAGVVMLNTAERGGLLVATDATQILAPVAQLGGIVLLAVLFRTVPSGLSLLASIVSLAALVGVEFVTNLVFAQVDAATIDALLAGPLGLALTIVSVGFLVATVWLVVAQWTVLPRLGLLAYGVGAVVVSLRAFVPDVVLNVGLLALAAGITVLALAMLRGRLSTPTPVPAS